jgi:ornithine cyclodeaminase
MTMHLDAATVEPHLSWRGVIDSIIEGHTLGRPQVDDTLFRRRDDSLLSRVALIDGLGSLVKTATVFPANTEAGLPAVNGTVSLFSDTTGEVDATIDFHLLTKWKTAADSALAASRLARAATERILIIGSGTVAASMVDAYRAVFPTASVTIWSRTHANAVRLAESTRATATDDLVTAVGLADVICTATMTQQPVLRGRWLHHGQHVDLIGGYRSDMRETDDDAMAKASIFVDSKQSAMDVGDVLKPLSDKVITQRQLVDFGGLSNGSFARSSDDEITICKNAGGAHLDLMVARHMYDLSSASH